MLLEPENEHQQGHQHDAAAYPEESTEHTNAAGHNENECEACLSARLRRRSFLSCLAWRSPEQSGRHQQENAEQSREFAGARFNSDAAPKIAAQENPQGTSCASPPVHQSLPPIEQQRSKPERRQLHEQGGSLGHPLAEPEK